MYLRLTRGRFDPANFDQIQPLAQEVHDAVKRLPGIDHIHQAADRASGELVAVSIWDTEEHARFSRDLLGDLVARIQAAGVQLDPPAIYEVTAG